MTARRYQVASRRDPHGLTPGERACADLLCAGASTAEIAAQLGMTANGVCTHLCRAYRKLGVHCAARAVDVLTGRTLGLCEPFGEDDHARELDVRTFVSDGSER